MTARARLATVWLGGCAGCHMSLLDLDEGLLELLARVELCYSPLLDVKEFPEGVDLTLVEGAVTNEDHLRELRRIRERTRVLVAFGDCAVTGNVPALRNILSVDEVLDRAYRDTASVVNGVPAGDDLVPPLLERVLRIQDVVAVDHFLPGCPPTPAAIRSIVVDLLAGRAPSRTGWRFGA